jgi:hypothetical protein
MSLYNEHQWVKNEASENTYAGKKTVHRTFNVPDDKTLSGTVYFKNKAVQIFRMEEGRKIVSAGTIGEENTPFLVSGQGYDTGILVMEWTKPVEPHDIRLIMSYEYCLGDEYNEHGDA